MKVLISGSTGMIGTALANSLRNQAHEVARLFRPGSSEHSEQKDVLWDPVAGSLGSSAERADAVVHLAGASIAGGRWTASRKRLLRASRVDATRHLVAGLGKLRRPPQLFIAASAVGFYGSRGDEELTETSAPGSDFLAVLTREWEAESGRAAEFGARVVMLRFGIVLAKHGGALPKMALPFRLGVGGRIGTGRQWMSWITLEDVVGIIGYAMTAKLLSGPVNAVTPYPVQNAEFTRTLAHVFHRPAFLPAPGFAIRLILGEMADGLLLASQRALPTKLNQIAYRFAQPELGPALKSTLEQHD